MWHDTALKPGSKCSFIPYELHLFAGFRLVSHSSEQISTAVKGVCQRVVKARLVLQKSWMLVADTPVVGIKVVRNWTTKNESMRIPQGDVCGWLKPFSRRKCRGGTHMKTIIIHLFSTLLNRLLPIF